MGESGERRSSRRYELDLPARLRTAHEGSEVAARICDISSHGMRVEVAAQRPPAPGTPFECILGLPAENASPRVRLQFSGRVLRVTKGSEEEWSSLAAELRGCEFLGSA